MAERGKGLASVLAFAFSSVSDGLLDLLDSAEFAACAAVCMVMVGVSWCDGDSQPCSHRLAQAGGDVVALLAQIDESGDDLTLAGDAQGFADDGAVAVELAPQRFRNQTRQVLFAGDG